MRAEAELGPVLPSWILTGDYYDDTGKLHRNFLRERKARDTFVGIINDEAYSACGSKPCPAGPLMQFPDDYFVDGEEVLDTSLLVHGMCARRITSCTTLLETCVIPFDVLETLGWPWGSRATSDTDVDDRNLVETRKNWSR